MTNFDLMDLNMAFILIRGNIEYNKNIEILNNIKTTLGSNRYCPRHVVRRAITSVDGIDRDIWDYAFHKDLFYNFEIYVDDSSIYKMFSNICDVLIDKIENKKYIKAASITDDGEYLTKYIFYKKCRMPIIKKYIYRRYFK